MEKPRGERSFQERLECVVSLLDGGKHDWVRKVLNEGEKSCGMGKIIDSPVGGVL